MSIYGLTKNTEVEAQIDEMAKLEEQGGAMYFALALLAEERGLGKVAKTLRAIAIDELHHAGFYKVLNGRVNQDIFKILAVAAEQESNGVEYIKGLAKQVAELGHEDAALKIEKAALDEKRHGDILNGLVRGFSGE